MKRFTNSQYILILLKRFSFYNKDRKENVFTSSVNNKKTERVMKMDYLEIKQKLEAAKQDLMIKMQDPAVLKEDKERIQKSIANYEYMIELTDMNHFERGKVTQ